MKSFLHFLQKTLLLLTIGGWCTEGTQAQDLGTLGQQKPLTISGGISVRTIFYSAKGIEARRQPFSYVVAGAPVLNLYGISIPLSFVFSEQERSFRQPFNQLGMSPTYKWVTVHAGYRNLTFSPYTLAGHTMLGAGVELNPGLFRFGFMYGRLNRATAVDTTSGSLQPFSYTRVGYAAKIGVGNRKNFVELSMVKARDDSSSASAESARRNNLSPAENAVVGISARLTFLKNFFWEVDGGLSLYTRHIGSRIRLDSAVSLLPGLLRNTLGQFVTINGSTAFYSAYHTTLGYKTRTFALRLQYRRVDPGYQSMGAYFFNNDLENLTIGPSFTTWQGKLRFSGSLGVQRDNLQNQKQATSRRVIGSANLSVDLTERLGLDLGFSNFSTNQRARTVLIADSFLLAQTTRTFSLSPRYVVMEANRQHVLLLSYNRMTLSDRNDWADITSDQVFFNYQLTFTQTGLSLSLNLNSSQVKLATGSNGNKGITLGISKRMMENKLLLGFNTSYLQGNQGYGPATILNNGLRLDLQAHPKHRFNALVNLIGNYPDQPGSEFYNRRYTEYRGELGYQFLF
jgi:hypothetical protein